MRRVESGLVTGCQAVRARRCYTGAAPGAPGHALRGLRLLQPRRGRPARAGAAVRPASPRELLPSAPEPRDSRGLARALTGNVASAIEDFTAFIASARENAQLADRTADREIWIATLPEGRNPFDAATLAALRDREG
jgi:hypothetical protein